MKKSENTWHSLGNTSYNGTRFKEKTAIYLHVFFAGD